MGRNGRVSPAVALGLVALAILLGIIYLARGCHHRAVAKKALSRPFWCEQCQYEFMAPWRSPTAVCPKCEQETAIARHYYVCKKCGERFLAFDMDLETVDARLPGEDWGLSVYALPEFPCPKCSSKDTALEKYKKR